MPIGTEPVSRDGRRVRTGVFVRLVGVLLAAGVWAGVQAGDGRAAVGDLTQKPGSAGCVGAIGLCSPAAALDGAVAVAISPDGKNAYVGSFYDGALVLFDRAADGTLTQRGCISQNGGGGACASGLGGGGVTSVAISPDGKSVYVASTGLQAVAVFDRAADGTLVQKPGAAGCIADPVCGPCSDAVALHQPTGVAVSPDGTSVYVTAAWSSSVVVFDRAPNGELSQKPGTAGCHARDASGGACANARAVWAPQSTTVSPDGSSVYVASAGNHAVAVFDRAAGGALSQKPGSAGCISEDGSGACVDGRALNAANSVIVSPDGQNVYVTSYSGHAVAVLARGADGALSQDADAPGCISYDGAGCIAAPALVHASGLAISRDGASVYLAAYTSDAVVAFDRAASGTLSQMSCVSSGEAIGPCVAGRALDGATGVAISPDGTSVYAAAASSDSVSIFDREGGVPRPPPPAPPPPPPPAPAPPAPAAASADSTRPSLSAVSLSPSRFAAARLGASISTRGASTVSYRLSEPAAVRFTVQRATTGRRVRGRCVIPRPSHVNARRCARYQTITGSFTHQGTTGLNTFAFTGRLRSRSLRAGSYRLKAIATDGAGNTSHPRHRIFRVVRRR